MENLENENKDKNILTDEQMKEVDGGAVVVTANISFCHGLSPKQCKMNTACEWSNAKCVNKY